MIMKTEKGIYHDLYSWVTLNREDSKLEVLVSVNYMRKVKKHFALSHYGLIPHIVTPLAL